MRQEFDKEFDALLRRSASRSGNAPAARGATTPTAPLAGEAHTSHDSSHLDADERAAFAEGALPAPARAAYVSHLADCGECRRAVAGLSSAAGVSLKLEKSAEAASGASTSSVVTVATDKDAGRLGWFKGLFAPRVLRFVAPALAFTLVGVVAFVALRSDGGGETQTARQDTAAPFILPGDAAADAGNAASNGNMSADMNASGMGDTGTSAAASNTNGAGTSGTLGARTAGGGRATADASAAEAGRGPAHGSRAEASSSTSETVAVTRPPESPRASSAAAAPSAAQRPSAREESDRGGAERSRDADEVAERGDTSSEATGRSRNYNLMQQQAPDGARNRGISPLEMRGANTSSPPPPAATSPSDSAKSTSEPAPKRRAARGASAGESRSEPETRAIEGRRFRRTAGVWIDENFRDSMPTTVVRRNTTAYSDLIAKSPEVGHIAERLSGEVVVVVRGHAYRVKP